MCRDSAFYIRLYLLLAFVTAINSLSNISFAQVDINSKLQVFELTFKDTILITGDKFLIQNSDTLEIENFKLKRFDDYIIDYNKGIIKFSVNLFQNYPLDTNRIYKLKVKYDLFPFLLKDEYSLYDIVLERDTLTGDTVQYAIEKGNVFENLFETSELEKSGSIFRGFTVGSNRDLTLNSGFRLQMNGKLSRDIEITAALTDENTSIQPEGNTLKLQELDKVYIELKSKNVTATIGDIDINFHKSEFFNLSRKIQGAKGFGDFNFGNFLLTGAVSRGKFSTNSFNGIDGVQGPYRLSGSNNEINILVLSGTEKVYLDGVLLTRGEQADYIIDYALGQITFTNKRIITNASRIVVDFEYTERRYSRTFVAYNNNLSLVKNKFDIGFSYLNETDNENKTIDFDLSDSDRVILRNAGDEPTRAFKSGVTYAGRDSITFRGIGAYVKIDTIINGQNYSFYRFAPADSNAVYNVSFSYVGQGKGDYSNISSYQYKFVGINQGSYAPVIFLPVPTGYQLVGTTVNLSLFKDDALKFSFEGAYSYLNKNKFSDNANLGGIAFSGNIGLLRRKFNILGIRFEELQMKYKERYINKNFNAIDRINEVEFYRNYDLTNLNTANENFREGWLSLIPSTQLQIIANIGHLQREDLFTSTRLIGEFRVGDFSNYVDTSRFPKLKYSVEKVSSKNKQDNMEGTWTKHNAEFKYRAFLKKKKSDQPILEISTNLNSEKKENFLHTSNTDSLTTLSFGFFEIITRMGLNNIWDFNFYSEFNYRKDDSPVSNELSNFSKLFIQRYGFSYTASNWFYSNVDLSIQNRKYTEVARRLNYQDNKSVLVNSRFRISPLRGALQTDLFYMLSSERTAKIQKLFVLVPIGQGNYIYLGDLNKNGIQDENEFQLVNYDGNYIKLNLPTDEFFPTVELKTSASIYLKPSRYLSLSNNNLLFVLINNISTETILRVEEKSKDPTTENIYFLKFNTFLNDSNTLVGNQWLQQDINLFENKPEYSLRFRIIQQRGFSQFTSGNERLYNILKSVKLRLGLTNDLTTQFEFINKVDRNVAPINSIRNRDIISNSYNFDFTYRPIPQVESGLLINYSKATDYYPPSPVPVNINMQTLRFIYSFATSGRIRLEVERDEVIFNSRVPTFPFELTMGRVSGKSYFLRIYVDYNITKNIQANVNYDGRSEGNGKLIHTGRAQITAFF
ncbi:MAG: hypothetical protein ACP5P3_03340 [Ignavibacteria bacterium]